MKYNIGYELRLSEQINHYSARNDGLSALLAQG
jgi:hypothetical protein